MKFISTLLACAVTVVLLPVSGWGQMKPKRNHEVLTHFMVASHTAPTASNPMRLKIFDGATTLSDEIFSGSVITTIGSMSYSQGRVYKLVPNKLYHGYLNVDNVGMDWGEVKISAPPGYTVQIEGIAAPNYRVTPSSLTDGKFSIVLRENSGSSMLPAGMSLPPDIASFSWTISTGNYGAGLSGNPVELRAANLSSAMLSPQALIYTLTEAPEYDPPVYHSDGGLLELSSNQCIFYVRRGTPSSGYTVEIYSPYVLRSGSGDGPYSYIRWNGTSWVAAHPYRKFEVSNPESTWQNKIKIEKLEINDGGSILNTTTWLVTQTGSDWTRTETTNARIIDVVSNSITGGRQELITVSDSNGMATKTLRKYQSYSAWGQEELKEETANPEGTNGPALTTIYDYGSSAASLGRLISVKYPDESWVRWDYDNYCPGYGNVTVMYRPWKDSTGIDPTNAAEGNSFTATYSYQSDRSTGETQVFTNLLSGVITKIQGVPVGQTDVTTALPFSTAGNSQPIRLEEIKAYSASGTYVTSTRKIYHWTADEQFRGRAYSETSTDGTKTSYLRYKAYWWNNGDSNTTNLHLHSTSGENNIWGEYAFNGFSSSASGGTAISSWDGQTFDTVYMVQNRSTIDLVVYNDQGLPAYLVKYVYTGQSGGVPTFKFLAMQSLAYEHGVSESVVATNGFFEKNTYSGGRLTAAQGNDGSVLNYTPDALGRPTTVTKTGVSAYNSDEYKSQAPVYTHLTYDAAGNVLTQKASSSATASANPDDAVTAKTLYNKAGQPYQVIQEYGSGNLTTDITYSSDGRSVTAQFPAINGTRPDRVETKWVDGSLKSVTGSSVVQQYREVTVNSNGTLTTTIYTPATSGEIAAPTTSARYVKVTSDWLGRTVTEERPAPPSASPSLFTKSYEYDGTSGKLKKTSETGVADTLIKYNARQEPYRIGLNLSTSTTNLTPDDDLLPSSHDRFTETDSIFEEDGNGAWWTVTTTKDYRTQNSDTPTVSTVKSRWNKFGTGDVQSETVTIDIFGNETNKKTSVQRGSSSDIRMVTETIDHSDSTVNEVTVVRNGLLQKKQTPQNLIYRYYYDGRGRLVKETDPRTDSSETARVGYATNSDRIAWRQDSAGKQTDYSYYSGNGLLQLETLPAPVSAGTRPKTYAEYTLRGETRRRWGSGTYPVEYEFNGYGEMVKMRTFRATSGIDFTAATWPHTSGYPSPDYHSTSAPTGGDPTIWSYSAAAGTLTSKTVSAISYGPNSAAQTTSYTYNSRGQLKTRNWARGVTTTYNYFGEQTGEMKTGELRKVDYSDTTTDLEYVYNRMGLPTNIKDATGERTLEYCDCGKVHYELLDSTYFGSRKVTHKIDSTTAGAKGRTRGYTLAINAGATEQDVDYGFDSATGRLTSITSGATYTYSYTTNSNLPSAIADTISGWTQTRTYLGNRNLLDLIETKFGVATKAAFDYDYDDLGRRKSVVNSGEMFARYAGAGIFTNFGYNDRSELTSGTTYAGRNTSVTSAPIPARNFGYDFDNIGNRKTASVDGVSASYEADARNQYKERAVSGRVAVTGFSSPAATVNITVDSTTTAADRFTVSSVANDFYSKVYDFSGSGGNGSAALLKTFTFSGSADVRKEFVTKTPESLGHDADGNMTSDGRWSYSYDAENRLIEMETLSSLQSLLGTASRKIQFTYDYMGRRVCKAVYNYASGAFPATATTETKFIYNVWNLIAEYTSGTLQATYLWGVDFSGSMQGAGGVGGLLQVTRSGAIYQPSYDGNGNVMALTARIGGAFAASYEYSPFGEVLRAEGTQAANNPFRFSTKYTDDESALVYYGLRYYSPSQGRFINRDPIAEAGGHNLYNFLRNNGVNRFDVLGLNEFKPHPYFFGNTTEDDERILPGMYDVGDGANACPFGYAYDGVSMCVKDDNAPSGPDGEIRLPKFEVTPDSGSGPFLGGGGGRVVFIIPGITDGLSTGTLGGDSTVVNGGDITIPVTPEQEEKNKELPPCSELRKEMMKEILPSSSGALAALSGSGSYFRGNWRGLSESLIWVFGTREESSAVWTASGRISFFGEMFVNSPEFRSSVTDIASTYASQNWEKMAGRFGTGVGVSLGLNKGLGWGKGGSALGTLLSINATMGDARYLIRNGVHPVMALAAGMVDGNIDPEKFGDAAAAVLNDNAKLMQLTGIDCDPTK